ncbi:mycothiol transferase [Jongsikchunia kroppenstedtii]|uniref:mycothiol transferase n=1 Tax=Jongsikchunia kroppenstedtii TaxID=1121721 RepID=UPI00035D20A9|nr:DUF664 domain-containing protein [Jongsikchunia kroppenstedtii]
MSDLTSSKAILIDGFTRVEETVEQVCAGLSPAAATYQPDPQSNSIAWLIWHAARQQDVQIAHLGDHPQVWADWYDRFDLPFEMAEMGYGQSPDEVSKVRVGADLLAGYHAAVHQRTLDYLDALTMTDIERVIDRNWTPPVTAGVRLVSIINDGAQHLGQAAYLRGVTDRLGL